MSAAPVIARSLKYKLSLPEKNKSFDFEKPVVRVGRDADNDVVISDDPKVSRHHLEIHFVAGQLILKNVSSKNFVHFNGQQIQEQVLEKTSHIRLGDTEIVIDWEDASPSLAVMVAPPQVNPAPAPQPSAPPNAYVQRPSEPRPKMSSRPQTVASSGGGSSRLQFYGIILAIGIGGYLFFSGSEGSKKAETSLRRQEEVIKAIEQSANAVKEITAVQDRTGRDTVQYKTAEEHYIKGFRDYRNGQYARAMVAFQAALSFYPQHEMARKYWTLAKRKFDEMVQLHMVHGRKYLGKNNFRMCKASFGNAMVMLKDPSDPVYKEAKQFYDECSLRLERGL